MKQSKCTEDSTQLAATFPLGRCWLQFLKSPEVSAHRRMPAERTTVCRLSITDPITYAVPAAVFAQCASCCRRTVSQQAAHFRASNNLWPPTFFASQDWILFQVASFS